MFIPLMLASIFVHYTTGMDEIIGSTFVICIIFSLYSHCVNTFIREKYGLRKLLALMILSTATGYVTGGGLYEGMACLAKEDCFSSCAGVRRASADCEYGTGIYKSAKKFQGAGGDAGAEMPQGTGVQHPGAGRDLRQ